MDSGNSVVQDELLVLLLTPSVPGDILLAKHGEFTHPQACVALRVPRAPARWKAAPGFAKVCTKYPAHLLYLHAALDAIAAPCPPATAFLGESMGGICKVVVRFRQSVVHA